MKQRLKRNVPRRLLSLVLSAAMVLALLPAPAFAAEGDGLCAHHPEHTAQCGYVAAVEGHDCGHQHDDSCGYAEAAPCTHVCGDGTCSYQAAQPCGHVCGDGTCSYQEARGCDHVHSEACGEDGALCTHVCGDGTCSYREARSCDHVHGSCGYQEARDCDHVHSEACGYREASSCTHVHDEACGYVEAVAGQPCGFVCEVCAGEESDPTEPQPSEPEPTETQPEEKVITAWEWVDQREIIDPETGNALLPFAGAENVARFDDVVELLPVSILADGETLTLGQWTCEAYPQAGAYEGEFVFETTLPEGYVLQDGGSTLTLTVVLGDPEGEASEPTEPQPEQKVIADWEWIDDWEIIDPDSGNVLLPFASAENVARFDDILELLPAAIAADGEELPLGDWVCEAYPEEGAYEGEFVFETTLPEGYTLSDGTNVLSLTVVLGDPEGEQAGLLAITPSEPTQVDGVYQLSTKEHLYWFAQQVNSGNNAINAVLTQNITVNSGVLNTDGTLKTGSFEEWTPIGTADHPYVGSFDGKNHTIYGLYVNAPDTDYIGLFGYIGYYSSLENAGARNVTVQNVTIRDSYFAGKDYVGAVCGKAYVNWGLVLNLNQCVNYGTVAGNEYVGGICGYNGGNTTNCKNYGKVSGSANIGGVCGESSFNSKSTGCYNEGTVTGSSDGAGSVGGICGYNRGSIENSSNIGAVRGKDCVGGVCGSSGGSSFTTSITGCDNKGTVTASGSFVGGICGYSYSQITNCHNTAAVQGGSTVGGVCGINNQGAIENCDNTASVTGNSSNDVGGVCGYNLSGTITSCYNTASVTGNRNASVCAVGGVCGDNSSGTITSCYNTGAVQGYYQVGGVCGKSQSSGAITLCYNTGALQGDDQVGGVCGYNYDSSISNCYNSSTIECSGSGLGGICGRKLGNSTLTNVYFDHKSDTIKKAFSGQAVCNEGRTTEQFASGEVAYLLNGSSSSGIWRQNLDTGTRDETPNFTGAPVYKATSGECTSGYTNNASGAKNHVLENHKCVFCDYRDQTPIRVTGIESITASSKPYDGTTKAELNYNNLVLKNAITDTEVTGVSLTVSGTFDTPGAGQNKTVTIRLELTGTDKYYLVDECQTTTTTANISRREVTVTITPPSGTYGDTILPATARLNNVVSGDNVPVTLQYVGSAYDGEKYSDTKVPQKAGAYEVVATIPESNYTLIGTHRENFVIEKATVTTPTIPSKEYTGQHLTADVPASDRYNETTNNGGTNAGTYDVALTLTDSYNYQWDDQKGETSFTIGKKPLTVTAENKTVTFGDPAPEYTARYEGFVTGETAESLNCVPTFTCNYSVGTSVNQSGYPISVSGLELSNYEIRYTPGTLTVNPKTLDDSNITLTVADESLVYTGSALTPDVSVVWGDKTLIKDTDFTVDYSNNVNAGSAPQVTVTGAGNYTGTKSTSFTIQPRDISGVTIVVANEGNWVYSGSPLEPGVSVTNGDYTITKADYTVYYKNNVNAGENTAEVVLTGKNNYTGTASKTFSIAKAPSGVSPHPVPVSGLTYSGQPQALVTAGGTTHGTLVYSLAQNGTYTSDIPTGTNAGSYTVWYKVLGDGNHLDSNPASVSCAIGKVSLTVTAKDHTITYGDAPANDGVTYDGFVNGETETVLGGELAYDYSYSQYGDVGSSYTITPSGLTSDNYAITFEKGTLTVDKKELGISWGDTQLTYNGDAQMPTATPTGFVNNDAITLTVSGAQTNAGSGYTATVTAIEGTKAGNYALPENVTTTFSIAQKEVTITGATVEAAKVYDGKVAAQITSNGTLSDNYDGGNLTIVPGSAAYDTKDVGNGKKVTFSGFSLGGSAADNYKLTAQPASVTADITAKEVTLTVTVKDKPFDGTTTAEIDTVTTNDFVEKDDVQVVNGKPGFTLKTPGENIPVSFTEFTLTGDDAGNYSITNPRPTDVTGKIKPSSRYLDLEGDTDFDSQTEVWIDGVKYPIEKENGRYVVLPESGYLLTVYTYKSGSSVLSHENYPTGMAVYRIVRSDDGATVERIDELDDLLQYSGCSIRVSGKRGIRMITSLTQANKAALKGKGLAGFTMLEYGTVVQWADTLGNDSLTLDSGNHNYAYKKGVADPVFANGGGLTQYTNVLVGFDLDECSKDIVMRPYIILRDAEGNQYTLYGGVVSRSIGYIAWQNRDTYKPGTAAYNYVHALMGVLDTPAEGGNEQ